MNRWLRFAAPPALTGLVTVSVDAASRWAGVVGPAAVAPLAASTVLVAFARGTPAVRPWAVVGGHGIAVALGVLAGAVLPALAATPLAAIATLVLTGVARALHPPAVASACIAAMTPTRSVAPLSLVIVAGAAALALLAARGRIADPALTEGAPGMDPGFDPRRGRALLRSRSR